MKKRKTFALIRALAAVIVAVILLACSGFAFVDLLGSKTVVTEGNDLTVGTYSEADIAYIMDICGVETNASGKEVAYYAIAPVGNEFIIIRFPASEYDTIASLREETQAYLEGTSSSISFHISVVGMAEETSATLYQMLTQWFTDNAEWMSTNGVISAVDDYTEYLGTMMIDSDTAGSVSYPAAVTLSVIAAVLVVYAIVEVVCVAAGAYNGKEKKQKDA